MKLTTNLKKLLNQPDTLSEIFHQKTKINKYTQDTLNPPKWPREWKTLYFKAYSRLDEVTLPTLDNINTIKLKDALIQRKSSRIFTKRLSLSQIGTLLYYSSGINKNKHFNEPYRFYPSAGARYPLELYIISLRSNLPSGLYHYYVKNHSLEVLLRMEKFDFNKYLLQKAFNKCSVLIIITAVFQRNLMKYGDRGYRYILIEAGHVGQNIYLLSSALNLNCCAVGGFVDDSLNNLLHIDGLHESVLYVFAVG